MVSWVRYGTLLYRFLIFAFFLTLKMFFLQAIEIIDEVGDLLQLKYSRLPPPKFTENEIELLEVGLRRGSKPSLAYYYKEGLL